VVKNCPPSLLRVSGPGSRCQCRSAPVCPENISGTVRPIKPRVIPAVGLQQTVSAGLHQIELWTPRPGALRSAKFNFAPTGAMPAPASSKPGPRMNSREKTNRDNEIVAARMRGQSWTTIAANYGLSERQCQQILADYRASHPRLRQRDPIEIVDVDQRARQLLWTSRTKKECTYCTPIMPSCTSVWRTGPSLGHVCEGIETII
jgi:hypothetical protein